MTDQKKQTTSHRFSLQERIEMIKIFYSGNSLKQTARLFAERHPECLHMPTTSGITRLVRKFESTGSVLDRRIPGRPKSLTEKNVDKPTAMSACEWPGCPYVSSKKCMARHRLVHKTERNHVCDWPQCEKRFKSGRSLRNHLRIHLEDKRYACNWPGCQYRCVDSGNIRKHKKTHERHFQAVLYQKCESSELQSQTSADDGSELKFEITLTDIVGQVE